MGPGFVWLLLACSGGRPPVGGDDTGQAEPPPPVERVGVGVLDVSCAPQNALRFTCTVRPDAPGEAVLEAWPRDDPGVRRRFEGRVSGASGDLLVWGLKPETTYSWRAESGGQWRIGELVTGGLPDDFTPRYEATGSDDQDVEALLAVSSCAPGWLHLLDADGDVIWYLDLRTVLDPVGGFTVAGAHRTEEGTVLAVLGRERIVEVNLGGEVLLDLRKGRDFEHSVHHDLVRRDGVLYALYAEVVASGEYDYMVDGVYAWDADGVLIDEASLAGAWPYAEAPWMVDEGYWTGRFPNVVDFTHANSLFVDAGGDLVLSLRHLHAVVGLAGGPGTPGFGDVQWTLVGDPTSPLGAGDFGWVGPAPRNFSGQHDAQLLDATTLLMFDNRLVADEPGRVAELRLDWDAATVQVRESWSFERACPVQGVARRVGPRGHVVATCSSAGQVREFRPGSAEPVWEMEMSCGALPFASLPRAVPWPLTP